MHNKSLQKALPVQQGVDITPLDEVGRCCAGTIYEFRSFSSHGLVLKLVDVVHGIQEIVYTQLALGR